MSKFENWKDIRDNFINILSLCKHENDFKLAMNHISGVNLFWRKDNTEAQQ